MELEGGGEEFISWYVVTIAGVEIEGSVREIFLIVFLVERVLMLALMVVSNWAYVVWHVWGWENFGGV